jgi:hypothetical protein
MNLVEKIKTIYPELTGQEFKWTIIVQDDADGRGMYIAKWEHPTLQRPTDEQLAQITE